MIRPASEINYPPTHAQSTKARMLARMEALSTSSDALMAVIASRLGAEMVEKNEEVKALTLEQERLLENMRKLVRN